MVDEGLAGLFSESESWNYFQRNYAGRDLRQEPPSPYLERLIDVWPASERIDSVLEVGCSAGSNLSYLRQRFGPVRAVGTEPSAPLIELLSRTFPENEFYRSDSRSLDFRAGEFDLVLLRSVLHWIDRDYYLQVLGEALRVCRRFLIVSDFSPLRPARAEYAHHRGYFTFKMSYRPLLEATNLVRTERVLLDHPEEEWGTIESCLYRKLDPGDAFYLQSPPG
jgi:SAM-dependent methyltransferase